jgi:lipopolysaccharide/colanic/teichoic acid biosynthesis glycosyltransferase
MTAAAHVFDRADDARDGADPQVVALTDEAPATGAEIVSFPSECGLSRRQQMLKRATDVVVASGILLLTLPLLLLLVIVVRLSSPGPAFFRQERIGRYGRRFLVIKLRTMRCRQEADSSITVARDPRVTRVGSLLRATRLDELPQLWNVLKGEMSLVGPRPDVPGFADELRGPDRRVLAIRPGITCPATLYFRHEAELLADHPDPAWLNEHVIYPQKVELNLAYLDGWSFSRDLGLLLITALPFLNRWLRLVREPTSDELQGVTPLAALADAGALATTPGSPIA